MSATTVDSPAQVPGTRKGHPKSTWGNPTIYFIALLLVAALLAPVL
jgi:hypothetical protein